MKEALASKSHSQTNPQLPPKRACPALAALPEAARLGFRKQPLNKKIICHENSVYLRHLRSRATGLGSTALLHTPHNTPRVQLRFNQL